MNQHHRTLILFALSYGLLVSMFLTPTAGFAQAISGNIVGTVTDSSGAVVTGASVEADNVATGVTTSTKTNGAGAYRFDNLPVGTYNITVKGSG